MGNTNKLESRTRVCLYVGYPNEAMSHPFYHYKESQVVVSINAMFLEDDYIMMNESKVQESSYLRRIKGQSIH